MGYFILDTRRDRLAYPEPMAMVLIIGLLGFLLDAGARGLYRMAGRARWCQRPHVKLKPATLGVFRRLRSVDLPDHAIFAHDGRGSRSRRSNRGPKVTRRGGYRGRASPKRSSGFLLWRTCGSDAPTIEWILQMVSTQPISFMTMPKRTASASRQGAGPILVTPICGQPLSADGFRRHH
jgi:hypothetical protein